MLARGVLGFAFVPMQAASYSTIRSEENGRASSIFPTQRQVGISLGVAIMASILGAHMSLSHVPLPGDLQEALTGVRWAFGAAVLMALIAAGFSFFIRDEDAAATMVARRRRPEVEAAESIP